VGNKTDEQVYCDSYVHAMHLDNYRIFSPTDVQLDSLKKILNLHLMSILMQIYSCF